MTLKIYSGKTEITVNLDDGVDLYLARNGWKQSGPEPGPGDVWYDVEEKIGAQFVDYDGIASVLNNLGLLSAEAAAVQGAGHRDYLNPAAHVFIEAKSTAEEYSRWALVRDLHVPDLDTAHYSGRLPRLNIELVREGLWRYAAPGVFTEHVVETTIRSVDGMGNGSHVTIPASFPKGDAPGLLRFTLRPDISSMITYNFKICRRIAKTSAELDDFQPFLWFEDVTIGTPTLADIDKLASPLDSMQAITPTQAHEHGIGQLALGWEVEAADYAGRFSVFLIFAGDRGVNDPAEITFQHGFDGNLTPLTTKELPDQYLNGRWGVLHLGQIEIPNGMGAIRGGLTNEKYQLLTSIQTTANLNVALAGIVLVPDEPAGFVLPVNPSPSYRSVADGEIERAYTLVHSSGDIQGGISNIYGPFPTLEPGYYNRFHFLPYYDPALGGTHAILARPSTNYYLNMDCIHRCRYLRE